MDGRLFAFEHVVVEKSGRRILNGVTGHIPDHCITVIVGPSGAGKSTVLRLCNGLDAPSQGQVLFRGQPIESASIAEHRRQVGMVFQQPTPLPGTVADNLRAADPSVSSGDIDVSLERVHLEGAASQPADQLSGGQAQRMCLARTLLTQPRFVLFDESTSSLDPSAAAEIESLASGLAADGIASAWVTHDLEQMRRLAHHVIVVIDGAIAQQGHAEEVFSGPVPAVRAFFGGGSR